MDAAGAWPGRCRSCGHRIEADPVPDILPSPLDVLFVGINPGIQTARTRLHFANPRNRFWRSLAGSGLYPSGAPPGDLRVLAARGIGITNIVRRATPGSSDITPADVEHGRVTFVETIRRARPTWIAFVGKQAYTMATGRPAEGHGRQEGPFAVKGIAGEGPSRPAAHAEDPQVFVLPSTSPANAAVSDVEVLAAFRGLVRAVTADSHASEP
ncbi:MAG: mismatch-specific DNA-glycosylase [Thermoplasmatota archaeon]